ncbi:putative acyltransferase yihG [Desulfamplus magnetovallimortis]|uniref:Putative acyltransferase yihG n=1 Tax=Desulfamplus magnetovallimortis TaxID=1246637 RepID=A0A1W1H7G1_9BACT|nr:acyltransferase [Desulfamplus magnetovallimortis]SLM28412.1 putative acyltransferase yihG [Desulfamplus magnetovallimortis]
MLDFLPNTIKGMLSFLMYLLNTIVLCSVLFVVAFIKLVLPIPALLALYNRILISIAMTWVGINSINSDLFNRIEWKINGLEALHLKEWYLVLSNHQSWMDILVLQKVFRGKIPMLKFFLKKELIWVPILGLAWWALDFPFMRRYSSDFIKKNPHLKGKDLETTRKACEKFRTIPVSVMNFVEGTRFTPAKHERQKSPYKNLLNPRAGGVAFVLSTMGDCIRKIINVTIVYPDGADTFWGFISGRVRRVVVDIEVLPITDDILGDYFNDPVFKANFCEWLNGLWKEKDEKISSILEKFNK